ncbi:uncharacterized protein EURHEDRAFT_400367 [Aspergillus ruber CBS 135680]|uniref:Calcofluor white hypersensitive protein n=1 Tax=Aspergillus ruber (strain CBS 135680) TaxID=1388766 RepID=A0A017SN49_ASPRC|nr:uncharacterized protein EURHEDRAFT_400367 [Aspergillus ruber CBS 135680]EYE98226.1 hypothetical protein EURHEDRAFT_400367 [Aspergillus ruber CBS 135680]
MAQSRAPVYLGLAGLSAGAFYLYRAGGDPKTATQELKADASKASGKVPSGARGVVAGENAGAEGTAVIDEAINNARSSGKPDERIPEVANQTTGKLEDAREKLNAGVDKLDRKVEEKASEAKGGLSGWFGK